MDNIDHIKMASFQELQQLMKLSMANAELLEYLSSSIQYLIYYSSKHNIQLPEREKIGEIVKRKEY